ncbi:trypsin [Ventosimonas gracilis]|uniref:Serine protease n=1 Tax=Ventosimonas gracilis TaxID=1680762 RepID=A0A139SXE0_9GAMM|nr:trypsin-like peptidase domain-containing protein [Ventosimonas gracilis]KXU39287.1 trypsin [Ventosimonas gracilis]
MTLLTAGANIALEGSDCVLHLCCDSRVQFGEHAAMALLAVDDKRKPIGEAALFHAAQPWMQWDGNSERIECRLRLAGLPEGSRRVLVVLYRFSAKGPVRDLGFAHLQLNESIEYRLNLADHGEAAIIVGEFYCRGSDWKFRALAESSAYGLAALGRRLGIAIDDAHPDEQRADSAPSASSGTGFAVTQNHILTCAHVIEGMREFQIASFAGRHSAEPLLVDERNDLALLRVSGDPGLRPLAFRTGAGCTLGEPVVALGFPMAGFAGGGLHVTQGGVSALLGLHNDASRLQFTAPIQPGSSGSPLFDSSAAVVGMVTSSLPDAQNMNFALKPALILAFLQACSVSVQSAESSQALSAAQISQQVQSSLWRIEARA